MLLQIVDNETAARDDLQAIGADLLPVRLALASMQCLGRAKGEAFRCG